MKESPHPVKTKTLCRLDAGCDAMSICEQEIYFSLGTDSRQRRARRRCHTVLAAGDYLRALSARRSCFHKSLVQSRLALSEVPQAARVRSCRIEKSPPTPDAAPAKTPAEGSAPRRAGPCQHRSQSTNSVGSQQKNQQDNSQERRNDEFHADVVPFLPRFLLQELIFAHCPDQPRRPIRGKFLTKSDWLSLRGIAGTECDILPIRIIANHRPRGVGKWISSVKWSAPVICSPLSHSLQPTQHLCLLRAQRFGSGNSSNSSLMSGPAKPWEVDTQERRRRARARCPVVAQHERKRHHPRGNGRITTPARFATYPLARTFRHRLSAVANSATRTALRDGTSCSSEVPTAVRINQHSGVRVSRSMQLFPSLPHAIILTVCCATTQTFTVLCPALFFSRFCVLTHTRSMAAPKETRTKRERHASQERKRRRSALSVSERLSDPTEHDEAGVHRNPPPRVNPVTDGSSLLHWLTSTATRSAATQTPNSVADGRPLQQWRSTQGKYWLVQHSTQQTLEQSRDLSRRSTARSWNSYGTTSAPSPKTCTPTTGVACCVEMVTSSAQQAPRRSAPRLLAAEKR